MAITVTMTDLNVTDFKFWGYSAPDNFKTIVEHNKVDEFEEMLTDSYPEGITDQQLNDLMWFYADEVYDYLGISYE